MLKRRHVAALAGVMLAGLAVLAVTDGPPQHPLPALVDVSGRITVGCGFDGAVSAPEICRGGEVIGVYIDDTTPNLRHWLALAAAKYAAPEDVVIAAVSPSTPRLRYGPSPPVLSCHEFYPVNGGVPRSVAEAHFPRHRACYIIQRLYGGLAVLWGGEWRPPSAAQYRFDLDQARRQRPRLILAF